MWPLIQQIETLLKIAATAAVLIVALGTPAAIVQYKRLALPLEFLTHEEAVRAGILPTIAMGILFCTAYLIIQSQTEAGTAGKESRKSLLQNFAFIVLVMDLLKLWQFSSDYLLLLFHIDFQHDWQGSWHASWRARVLLVVVAVPFAILTKPAFKIVRRTFAKPLTTNALFRRASIGVAAFVCASALMIGALDRVVPRKPPGSLVDVLASAMFVALYMLLASLKIGLRFRSDEERRVVNRQMAVVVLLIYLFAVGFYSFDWYPRIAHYIGGGKPIPVAIWTDKNPVVESFIKQAGGTCKKTESDVVHCDQLFLVSADDHYYILAVDDNTYSHGFLIPHEGVKLLSGR